MNIMFILSCTAADADALTGLTFASKQHWGYPDEAMEAWRSVLTVTSAYLASAIAFKAVVAGQLAGYYTLLPPAGERMVLDNLFVHPDSIGQGVGKALLAHALAEAGRRGAREVEVESDPHAAGFYERQGGRRVGGRELMPIDGQRRIAPVFVFAVTASAQSDPCLS